MRSHWLLVAAVRSQVAARVGLERARDFGRGGIRRTKGKRQGWSRRQMDA